MCRALAQVAALGLTDETKTKQLLIKEFGMDANLGVMTVRRQSRRTASPLTRWSRSAFTKDIGSNHEPRATVSSDGSAILSRLAISAHSA
jgi:hypothetical protein